MRSPSFRTRLLLVVLVVAVVPFGLVGVWVSGTMSSAGEEVLASRLTDMLDRTVQRIGVEWLRYRSDILFLGEEETVQTALANDGAGVPGTVPDALQRRFDTLDPIVRRLAIRDKAAADVWTLDRTGGVLSTGNAGEDLYRVELAIYDRATGQRLGALAVDLALHELLSAANLTPTVAGMVTGAFDAESGAAVLPLPFDPNLLSSERFSWGGDEWITARRTMTEPPMVLVAAAPVTPFSRPLEHAARRAAWLIALMALGGVGVAVLLTGRMTRSLEELAAAADSVSAGNLDHRVEESGADEVGRVARSFNAMTRSLRDTLKELSHHERLAAMGEFAASLAHEVRNPLTAIRVDLQRVEEGLPADSPLRETQQRALQEIARLDATVGNALDAARQDRTATTSLDLRNPIRAAVNAATPAFEKRAATIRATLGPDAGIDVAGDAGALEQLFLNLLLNAAAALGPNGSVSIELTRDGGEAAVSVQDNGTGIAPEILERVFEPRFTTRPRGNGLGLTIAQRIAEGHGGRLTLRSEVGRGTTARVALPALDDGSASPPWTDGAEPAEP